ncbi:unnamed protein product [Gadus morhua 'NCC']
MKAWDCKWDFIWRYACVSGGSKGGGVFGVSGSFADSPPQCVKGERERRGGRGVYGPRRLRDPQATPDCVPLPSSFLEVKTKEKGGETSIRKGPVNRVVVTGPPDFTAAGRGCPDAWEREGKAA